MVETYDVGSLPFTGDLEIFSRGSKIYPEKNFESLYFEKFIVKCFADKIRSGISVPNYPQFRDMNEMFFELMENLVKINGKYYFLEKAGVAKNGKIPEIEAVRRNVNVLAEKYGKIRMKICITGPYTLSYFFGYRDYRLFQDLTYVLAKIVEANVLKEKNLEVAIAALDEPLIGTLDDPFIDYGSEGREYLIKSLNKIFHEAKAKNAKTVIHLHSTTNDLFWHVENLDIIESHVDDFIYKSSTTKKLLEKYDKFLKASICRTDFDRLVYDKVKALGLEKEKTLEAIAEIWKLIKSKKANPIDYLEDLEVLKTRLRKAIKSFGERVLYAGPECGMKGFPDYKCAIECLKRVAKASITKRF